MSEIDFDPDDIVVSRIIDESTVKVSPDDVNVSVSSKSKGYKVNLGGNIGNNRSSKMSMNKISINPSHKKNLSPKPKKSVDPIMSSNQSILNSKRDKSSDNFKDSKIKSSKIKKSKDKSKSKKQSNSKSKSKSKSKPKKKTKKSSQMSNEDEINISSNKSIQNNSIASSKNTANKQIKMNNNNNKSYIKDSNKEPFNSSISSISGKSEMSSFSKISNSNINQSKIDSDNNSNDYVYTDEPIQLIDFSKGFRINPKALRLLNSITDDVVVVSIVGKARTGKSYLMNLLLDNVCNKSKKSFEVSGSYKSCTQGIWLWNNIKSSINDPNSKILFLDSEGTSSSDKSTKTYDSRIFALVVLISSLFLYNTTSNIDEQGINDLSLAAHLSSSITMNSGNVDKLLSDLAPKFIWVVRDFTLEKVDPETGEEISSKEYLELSLKNKRFGKGKGKGGEVNCNLIRDNILKYFPDRDCVTLVRPMDDEEDLQNLNNIPFKDLKVKFKMEFGILKDKIFKEARPKKFNGKRLNGRALACLIEQFVNTINNNEIPNISNSWDAIIEKDISDYYYKAQKSLDTSLQSLNIKQDSIYDTKELLAKINSFKYSSLEIFSTLIYRNADIFKHKTYRKLYTSKRKELMRYMTNAQNKIINLNNSFSGALCNQILIDKFHNIENKLVSSKYTTKSINELINDYTMFISDYNEDSYSDKKLISFLEFIIKKEKIILEYIIDLYNKKGNNELRKLEKAKKNLNNEIEEFNNNQRVEDTKKNMDRKKIANLERECQKLDEDIDDLKDTLQMKRSELERIKNANIQTRKNQQLLESKKDNDDSGSDDDIKRKGNKSKNKKRKNDDEEECGCTVY